MHKLFRWENNIHDIKPLFISKSLSLIEQDITTMIGKMIYKIIFKYIKELSNLDITQRKYTLYPTITCT